MTADPLKQSNDENASRLAQFQAEMKANPLKKGLRKILGSDMSVATYTRPDFRVIIHDEETTVEDVLRPEFWANVSNKLDAENKRFPFAMIEVIWGDASKYLRLILIDAGPLWAKVKIIEQVDLNGATASPDLPEAPAEFIVKRVNPALGWCIIRQSDNEYIKKNCTTKAEAEKELADLLRALKN